MRTYLLLLAVFLVIISCGCSKEEDTSYKVMPGAPPSSVPVAQPVVTQEMADQIQIGITLDEAREILGSSGTQIPREVKTVQGVTRYTWRNADGSYLILDIKDNKVGMKQWRAKKEK